MYRSYIYALCALFLTLPALSQEKKQASDSSIFSKPIKLEGTVKTERMPRSEQKGDTLIFNAAAYQVLENSDSERLISKMPGIAVSDGGIEANGKEIMRVLLDGQEFFGNDVLTALRNVPADLVKQIEIINKLSDSAQLTGVDDGEGYMALNIVTKRKKGQGLTTGRLYGSYGLSDSEDHKHNYITGGNMSRFTDKSTFSIIGMSNNISKFNFTSSEILSGATGLDAKGGSSFKVKALSGISAINSIGVSYTNKKFSFSYFFNDISNSNSNLSDKFTKTSTPNKELLTHNESDYSANNMTHKMEGKITLNPAKSHSFTIRPSLSFEDMYNNRNLYGLYNYVYTDKDNEFRRHQMNLSDNDRWSIRSSVTLNYRYKFKKRRRSFGVYARYGFYKYSAFDKSWEYRWSNPDADITDIDAASSTNIQDRRRLTMQHNATGKLIFTEPLNKRSLLSAEYTFILDDTEGENLVFPFSKGAYATEPKTRVSAINRSTYYHNRAGLRYNYAYKKISVAATLTYQNTIFNGAVQLPEEGRARRVYNHPLYNLNVNIPFNSSNTLKIEAKSRTQVPSNKMLQDIVDRSSTSNVRAGNPDIEPAYLNEIEMRYINTNKDAGTTFSFTSSYTGSNNYFCDSLVINNPDFVVMTDDNGKEIKLGKDNQFAKPINMEGYYKLKLKSTFAMPLDFMRSNFSIGAQSTIQKIPGMINEEKVPINRNSYQLSGRIDSNISKEIDFTLNYYATYTENTYNGKFGQVHNNYISHRAIAQLKWIFLKDYTFTGAFVYKNYRSTAGLYNDHFYLCDLFIGKRFLKNKRLEISVGVNDLFNDNIYSYSHSVNASGRTDGRNIGIGRYFSAQAIWHFRSGTRPKKIIK